MEYVELNEIENGILREKGIKIRAKHGIFINSNGYKTIKTARQNIKPLSDKIICLHTLFAWLKVKEDSSIETARNLYTTLKLETHHKDGNKLNNLPCNIIGFLDRHEHNKLNYLLSL
jgi:hypothetical protein